MKRWAARRRRQYTGLAVARAGHWPTSKASPIQRGIRPQPRIPPISGRNTSALPVLLESPAADMLGPPLRWFMTQAAKTFHRLRKRSGHFWKRRYRTCLVDDDLYALAAPHIIEVQSFPSALLRTRRISCQYYLRLTRKS